MNKLATILCISTALLFHPNAEAWVNGRLAGILLWPPYELDISALCRKGKNEVTLVVANSIANRFARDVWGTRGTGNAEPSGLLGPVRLWQE
jgi:hypothetical protein